MGLDIYLVKFSNISTNNLLEFWKIRKNIGYGFADHLSSQLCTHKKEDYKNKCIQIAISLDLPKDIENNQDKYEKNIEKPSKRHPNCSYRIGYWRSGYDGLGLNTILRQVLSQDLYDIFPDIDRDDSNYIKPNWQNSRNMMQNLLNQFVELGAYNYKFLEAIGIHEDHLQNLQSSSLSSNFKSAISILEEAYEHKIMFQDYVEEMEVIIETIDYVLSQPDINSYMLYWSA